MEVLHITATAEEGKIIINVPESLNGKEVNIVVSTDSIEDDWANLPPDEKIELLKTFIGKDKFPYIKVGKYDVYYQ